MTNFNYEEYKSIECGGDPMVYGNAKQKPGKLLWTDIEPDPIVAKVLKRMTDRSKEGIEKYGCTMTREDVTTVGWIDNAIEELLDASIYLERLKYDLRTKDSCYTEGVCDGK
jgi:hypothetical protein